MPKYLIKRHVPDAGRMTAEQLRDISQKSNAVLSDMTQEGNKIQWLHSYVTDDAIHCVYFASDRDVLREHGRCGGFPVDQISEVREVIEPATGE